MSLPLLLLMLSLAHGNETPSPEPGALADAAWADARDNVLPALEARARSASAAASARQEFFAGRASSAEAWGTLALRDLDRSDAIVARMAALDRAMVDRARELQVPVADLGSERRRASVARARSEALEAEEFRDNLERRWLAARLAFVQANPLWDAQSSDLEVRLEQAWSTATQRLDTSPEDPDELAAVDALDHERAQLRRWRAWLLDHAARPDPDHPPIDLDDVTRGSAGSEFALERLRALEAHLVIPELDETELIWIEQTALPQASAPIIDESVFDVDSARQTAVLAEARMEVLASQAPSRLRDARLELWTARIGQVQRTLDAEASRLSAVSEAERAKAAAQQAIEEAQRAREAATGAEDVALAELKAAAAMAMDRAAGRWENTRAFQEKLDADAKTRVGTLAELRREAREARSPMPDVGVRSLDEIYASVRTLVEDLRHDAAHERNATIELDAERIGFLERQSIERAALSAAAAVQPPTADAWQRALDDELAAIEAALLAARKGRDQTAATTLSAKALRRELVEEVSPFERQRDREALLRDAAFEFRLLGPNLLAFANHRIEGLLALPRRALDLTFLGATASGTLFTLLLTFAWWGLRRRHGELSSWLIRRLRAENPTVRPAELLGVRAPLDTALTASVDLAAGWILAGPLWNVAPELGLMATGWLAVACFRLALALYDLTVVPTTDPRPARWVVSPRTFHLLRWTLTSILVWVLSRTFTLALLVNVLAVDALGSVARFLFFLLGIAGLVLVLHAWYPPLRQRISRMRGEHHPMWPADEGLATAPVRVLWSAAFLGFLTLAATWQLLDLLARNNAAFGRMFNAFSRYRLGTEQPVAEDHRPTSEWMARFSSTRDAPVVRTREMQALVETIDSWKGRRQRGLVALVAERGAGKRTVIRSAEEHMTLDGRAPSMSRVEHRMTTSEAALDWLSAITGARATDNPEDLVTALRALPPRVWIVEDLHRLFLRVVGGFDGLNTVLYVMHATSDHHFWLTTFHGPAYRYLSRLGNLVNMGFFRTTVTVEALAEEDMRALMERRLSWMECDADFRPLMRSNPFGSDPEIELQRTKSLFFRLLAEASDGNPTVALELFADCLSVDSEDASRLEVRIRRPLAGHVDALADSELFALAALHTHELLNDQELAQVTNMAPGTIKPIVKGLESRQLLVLEPDGFRITSVESPRVTRTLRRRHFLHGEG